jgi:outer membrane usher protein
MFRMSYNAPGSTRSQFRTHLRLALLPALILGALGHWTDAVAASGSAAPAGGSPADVSFDADFFPAGMAPKVDLSRFEKGNIALPGTYRGDIVVNGVWQARTDIVMATAGDIDGAQPCFDAATLTRYGVDLPKVAALTDHPELKAMPEGQFCAPIGDYIPGATTSFDSGDQVLNLSVPQIYTLRSARGYVDPSQWDSGINAGVVGYNTNLYRTSGSGRDQTSGYIGLNASMNIGSWHAVHQGSMSWSSQAGRHYQSSASFLQHDIPSLRAQFTVGDTYTSGELFDSVRLRGARLYSDDRMLPDSMRGYAPVVRGIAETNAKIAIRQRGYLIYETTVAPGPFAIEDLYPTGYGGDLDIEITEADGRVKRFSMPFSAVTQLLRPGQSRWSVAAGKVEQLNLLDTPYVVQGTYQRGLTNDLTGYVGSTLATGYRSAMIGAAVNTGVGAFSLDATQARNQVPGQSASQGMSLRLGYNKNFIDTGTNFTVAAYRYSTGGYVSLNDAVSLRDAAARGLGTGVVQRQRSRMDVNINQTLGEGYGQLFVSGSATDYWNRPGRQVDFSAGYSNRWKSLNYSFTAQRTRDSVGNLGLSGNRLDRIPGTQEPIGPVSTLTRRDTRLFFTVSMPLGRTDKAPMLTALANRSSNDGSSSQATLSGLAGTDNRITYGATLGRADSATTLDLSGQYNGRQTNLSGGYSRGNGYQQLNAGASGSIVVHGGGVTLSPPTGETIGLVQAANAAGARVENGQGATVNSHGYAVVPYLTPYKLNTVTLDPKGTEASVELKTTTQNVAPRAGSVVLLKYETESGRALLIETRMPDGRPIPFGADVFDAQGNSLGVAGQASRLFVRGMQDSGTLTVRWGEAATEMCRIHVRLAPAAKGPQVDMETMHAPCVSEAPVVPKAAPQGTPVAVSAAMSRYRGVYGMPSTRLAIATPYNEWMAFSVRVAG